MYFHKPQEKPRKWGSFQDVQYAVMKNCEKIYGVDPDSIVLAMPLFWGLPLFDYSGHRVKTISEYGVFSYQDGGIYLPNANPVNTISSEIEAFETDRTILTHVYKYSSAVAYNGVYLCKDNVSYLLYFNNTDKDIDCQMYSPTSHGYSGSFGSWEPGNEYMVGSVEDVINNLGYGVLNDGQYALVKSGSGLGASGRWSGGDIAFGRRHWTTTYGLDGLLLNVMIVKTVLLPAQTALFHNRPWALYQPVSRPVWSIPAAPPVGAIMNQFQGKNLGADLFNGSFL